MHFQTVIKP